MGTISSDWEEGEKRRKEDRGEKRGCGKGVEVGEGRERVNL